LDYLLIANRKKTPKGYSYRNVISNHRPNKKTKRFDLFYLLQSETIYWYMTFVFADQILLFFFISLFFSPFHLFVLSDNIKIHRYRRHRLILLCSGTRIHRHIFSYNTSDTIESKEKRRRKSSTQHFDTNIHYWFLTSQYNIEYIEVSVYILFFMADYHYHYQYCRNSFYVIGVLTICFCHGHCSSIIVFIGLVHSDNQR
jgi:hypothetical protein